MCKEDDFKEASTVVQDKFREARFFLGKMQTANLELFSRNIFSTDNREFEYFLSAFSGALYSIDSLLLEFDDIDSLEEWENANIEYGEGNEEGQSMYDIFLGHERGIRHESIHIERAVQERHSTTVSNVNTRRTVVVGDQHGYNYVFPEEKSGNGLLKSPIVEKYRDEYNSGGRIHVPVVKIAEDYLYEVVYYCLEEQCFLEPQSIDNNGRSEFQ